MISKKITNNYKNIKKLIILYLHRFQSLTLRQRYLMS